jgi:hypothetical protein
MAEGRWRSHRMRVSRTREELERSGLTCSYYILRDDMLKGLIDSLVSLLPDAQWQVGSVTILC